jgi:hypothetical protein
MAVVSAERDFMKVVVMSVPGVILLARHVHHLHLIAPLAAMPIIVS